MALVLNTNIDSLLAQNSLTSSGSQLTTALQQLSSGLRINTAADDAAGYAISQGITSQINGMTQAQQNANDGVSLAQTAAGALQGVVNDLQSMRDLAVESLNASNGANDRSDLNAQFQQLMNDINSTASQTQFNGVNLLDGSFQGATFQTGANAGQSITMASIASTSSSAIGNYFTGVTSVSGSVKTAAGTTVNTTAGTAGGYSTNTLESTSGLNAASVNGYSVNLNVSVNGATAVQTGPITLTGTAATDLKSIAAAVNQALSSTGGLVATVNSNDSGITISGTSASGTGSVVNFSVGSASNSAGSSVTPGAATLGALGLDSSDVVGYYTPSLAAGATTPATPGTYTATNITTDLTGIKALSATNPGSVTLTVNDGTNTFTTAAISITGNAATDLGNIASALNSATSGATVFSTSDKISFAANGGNSGLSISGTNTGTVALSFGLSAATGNTGAAATPTLTALGVDASDSVAAGGVATPTTAGSYSSTSLGTDLSGSVAPSATSKASVVLGVSLNSGTVIDTSSISIDAVKADDTGAIVTALNSALSGTGFTASVGTNGVTITGSGGSNALATFSVVSAKDAAGNTVGSLNGILGSLGVDGSDSYAAGAAGTQTTSSSSQYLGGLNVGTVDNSNLVLISIDNALQQLATVSADIGAYQNRFQGAITGLTTDSTNLTSAKSAIVDANYASATSTLSQAQILQQAGTAMVAQANMIPQNILTLLQKLP